MQVIEDINVDKNKLMNRPKVANKDIEKVNHDILEVQQYEEQVIRAETKELKKYINRRRNTLTKYYNSNEKFNQEVMESQGLNHFAINKYLFEPLLKFSRCVKKYSEFEILMVLDYYQEQLVKINEHTMYPPQLEQFCRLLGLSTQVFKRDYVNSDSEEMRNAAQQVIDYIASGLSFAGMTKQVDTTSQVFAQKSSLGRVEKAVEQPKESNNNFLIVSSEDFLNEVSNILKK